MTSSTNEDGAQASDIGLGRRNTPSRQDDRTRRSGLALALLALAHFIVSVDFNIVYIALPEIGRQLGFTASSLQWVVSAYALGFGGFLLLGGRLVDRIGARRVFVAGAVSFGVASVVGALATDPSILIAARAGQGVAAALLFPATLALVNTRFAAGAERTRALAVWGLAGATGALAGGAAGGVLTSAFGWASVFTVMIPLTAVAAAAAPKVLAADARTGGARRGFDVPGATAATVGSLLVVFALVNGSEAGWSSPTTLVTVVTGVAMLGVFLLIESRTAAPLMPLKMLRNRNLVAAVGLIFVLMGPVTGMHYLYTTYLQDMLGYDALTAGLGFLPQSALAMAGSWLLLPRLLSRWGMRRALFVGLLGIAGSIVAIVLAMAPQGSYWALLPGLALFGLFAGTAYPAVFAAAGSDVRDQEQGVASAMTSTAQQIGGAMGLAVLIAVANAGHGDGSGAGIATIDGLRASGWVAALVTVVGAVVALAVRKTGTSSSAPGSASTPAEPVPTQVEPIVGRAPADRTPRDGVVAQLTVTPPADTPVSLQASSQRPASGVAGVRS
ncbi:MFS transporter [Phytoactinopolyspora halotolerans]|uniref:MFS transporter n=1 Tax=Phytoactinopolyspora halotolerans TaxID=1981512 RepID=A0A6L9SJR1_9ACTN|nr:MFS transporter [Phytoactinopolyspora halotolerans]NEE04310.1 MFS transporter [Phytoactinopolyspora halotolerans]